VGTFGAVVTTFQEQAVYLSYRRKALLGALLS